MNIVFLVFNFIQAAFFIRQFQSPCRSCFQTFSIRTEKHRKFVKTEISRANNSIIAKCVGPHGYCQYEYINHEVVYIESERRLVFNYNFKIAYADAVAFLLVKSINSISSKDLAFNS